jgi:hypothetical protein
MLQNDRKERPAAKTVFEWTKDLRVTSNPRFPYCGSCCYDEDGFLDENPTGTGNSSPGHQNIFAGDPSIDTQRSFEHGSEAGDMDLDVSMRETQTEDFPNVSNNIHGESSGMLGRREYELLVDVHRYFGLSISTEVTCENKVAHRKILMLTVALRLGTL